MKFFRSSALIQHKQKHVGLKRQYIIFRSNEIVNVSSLLTMKLNFSISVEHHCRHCGQSYMYHGDLNKHLRTHYKDGKIHECSKCQMRFKYLRDLNQHLNEHYKEERAADKTAEKIENNSIKQKEIGNLQ